MLVRSRSSLLFDTPAVEDEDGAPPPFPSTGHFSNSCTCRCCSSSPQGQGSSASPCRKSESKQFVIRSAGKLAGQKQTEEREAADVDLSMTKAAWEPAKS